jgi:hypothetical protein
MTEAPLVAPGRYQTGQPRWPPVDPGPRRDGDVDGTIGKAHWHKLFPAQEFQSAPAS